MKDDALDTNESRIPRSQAAVAIAWHGRDGDVDRAARTGLAATDTVTFLGALVIATAIDQDAELAALRLDLFIDAVSRPGTPVAYVQRQPGESDRDFRQRLATRIGDVFDDQE